MHCCSACRGPICGASEAIKANDYDRLKAVPLPLELRPLMPGNPRVMYNLAASYAKLGDTTAAIAELKQLAASGLIFKKPNARPVVSSIRRLRLP